MDTIQFHSDTAIMLPGEEAKLAQIAEILRRYNDRDIMVAGHTALAGGTAETRMSLSLERASTVAEYFIANHVRSADRIVVRGFGGDRPIATNATEAGRAQNRRVEITILEN
jgi:outer membrane protein OmpA-like peptidoglycan-associated protein